MYKKTNAPARVFLRFLNFLGFLAVGVGCLLFVPVILGANGGPVMVAAGCGLVLAGLAQIAAGQIGIAVLDTRDIQFALLQAVRDGNRGRSEPTFGAAAA